jgi:hypothetical protein
MHWEMRNAYNILVGKPLGKRMRRWEDNIRMYLRKIDGKLWNGFIWLRIGTSGGLLLTR